MLKYSYYIGTYGGTERNDVVGYATSVEYEFDRYTNDKVCEKICTITDDELVGTEAQVDIVTVDVFTADDKKRAIARKRTWSIWIFLKFIKNVFLLYRKVRLLPNSEMKIARTKAGMENRRF